MTAAIFAPPVVPALSAAYIAGNIIRANTAVSIADAIKIIVTVTGVAVSVPEIVTAAVAPGALVGGFIIVNKLIDYILRAQEADRSAERARRLKEGEEACKKLGWPGDDPTKPRGEGWEKRGGPQGKRIEIIGEAAAHLPDETWKAIPDLPYRP